MSYIYDTLSKEQPMVQLRNTQSVESTEAQNVGHSGFWEKGQISGENTFLFFDLNSIYLGYNII